MDPEQFQPKVLILGRRNRHRSQMLEGLLRRELNRFGVISAGLNPAEEIDPRAVEVMKELGVDIAGQVPNSPGQLIDEPLQMVVYVNQGVKRDAPVIAASCPEKVLDIPDPERSTTFDDPLDSYRELRERMQKESVPTICSDLTGGEASP